VPCAGSLIAAQTAPFLWRVESAYFSSAYKVHPFVAVTKFFRGPNVAKLKIDFFYAWPAP
jgi:hypothetical protein